MSRAVLYKRSEELKRRFSLYGMLTALFHLVTLLVGAVVYASSNLPVYLSTTAATTSRYGISIFFQSMLTLLSFIMLAVSALLVFLSRATTVRGEFSSSSKLLFSSTVTTGVALIFAVTSLLPPASEIINGMYYVYIAMIIICIALLFYAITLLKGVVNYYAPRRK
ncbi:conserved hypothetical protein [Pyrobaculum islandicum DSM 4184]|uniref:Multipass membrane protein n=1 Tax=Pyrobaculum islandicum (strain DSM 4184 / JCM 9189 / GEO3) TaxID=384616 RepID=A1RSG9_PYRIL|nr:hypothetical protein [Pyrobaculum islandicum]ABL87901.1 conserved hypothetical protein [Pyrobaculum islandicum DSM 4184]